MPLFSQARKPCAPSANALARENIVAFKCFFDFLRRPEGRALPALTPLFVRILWYSSVFLIFYAGRSPRAPSAAPLLVCNFSLIQTAELLFSIGILSSFYAGLQTCAPSAAPLQVEKVMDTRAEELFLPRSEDAALPALTPLRVGLFWK